MTNVATDYTWTAAFTAVFVMVFGVYWFSRSKKQYNLPPGPKGWPFVGMLYKLGDTPHIQFMEMAKKFGNVFSMKVGTQRVIVLNGYKAVTEALVDNNSIFSERPDAWTLKRVKDGDGIVSRNADHVWKERRTFMGTQLRDFTKRSLEATIHEEAEMLCEALGATNCKPVDCSHLLRKQTRAREDNVDLNDPRDYTEALVGEQFRNHGVRQSSTFKELKNVKETATSSVSELFRTATDPTYTALRWALVYSVKHPEIQEKIHNEIVDVIGTSRRATINDYDSMPFTQAAIMEAMRMVAPLSLAPPHSNTKDCKIGGYDIPKDSYVLPNFHSVHMDPEFWENPEKYDPSRFIGPDGKLRNKVAFMAFGRGHRKCPGENIARCQLFLFFTSFIQRFRFELAEDAAALKSKTGMSLINKPADHKIRCIPRT
uniref:Cytochrome P450 1A1-like n=1 Tax=Saccoglossus kowalevskii TaxID=10224 RepID=A0ABM0LX23_SACKO|nr:PREDICTED: cytochrome P450 1A1-like [Saccoglossus kowalevskii]